MHKAPLCSTIQDQDHPANSQKPKHNSNRKTGPISPKPNSNENVNINVGKSRRPQRKLFLDKKVHKLNPNKKSNNLSVLEVLVPTGPKLSKDLQKLVKGYSQLESHQQKMFQEILAQDQEGNLKRESLLKKSDREFFSERSIKEFAYKLEEEEEKDIRNQILERLKSLFNFSCRKSHILCSVLQQAEFMNILNLTSAEKDDLLSLLEDMVTRNISEKPNETKQLLHKFQKFDLFKDLELPQFKSLPQWDSYLVYHLHKKNIISQSHSTVYQALLIPEKKESYQPVALKVWTEKTILQQIKEIDIIRESNSDHYVVRSFGCVDLDSKNGHLKGMIYDLSEGNLNQLIPLLSQLKPEQLETLYPDLILQLLKIVQSLHNSDIIHRDLKPENILFFIQNSELKLRLCDFGFARKLDVQYISQTYVGSVNENGCWMPPEYHKKEPNTKSSDIWNLGNVLFYLMSLGNPLFQTPYEVIQLSAKESELVKLIDKRINLPPKLVNEANIQSLKKLEKVVEDMKKTYSKLFPLSSLKILIQDLILRLIRDDPKDRLSLEYALDHPSLCNAHLILHKLGVFFNTINRHQKSEDLPFEYRIFNHLNAMKDQFFQTSWLPYAYSHVMMKEIYNKSKQYKYDTSCLKELLRFIRNVKEHPDVLISVCLPHDWKRILFEWIITSFPRLVPQFWALECQNLPVLDVQFGPVCAVPITKNCYRCQLPGHKISDCPRI